MSDIWTPTETKVDTGGPEVRLLVCSTCETIEPLPDYDGPQTRAEELDHVLNRSLEKHRTGVERIPHVGQIFRVKESAWNNPTAREQILAQIVAKFDPNAETGLGADAYAMRDNLQADAMACWEQHMRTSACSDYKSDAKQLTPDTSAERREAGLAKFDKADPRTKRFLCEYCPVHSLVQQAIRGRAGLYE